MQFSPSVDIVRMQQSMSPSDRLHCSESARRGGIGYCIANCDSDQTNDGNLYFVKDKRITVIACLDEKGGKYLGHFAGSFGTFDKYQVRDLHIRPGSTSVLPARFQPRTFQPRPPSRRVNFKEMPESHEPGQSSATRNTSSLPPRFWKAKLYKPLLRDKGRDPAIDSEYPAAPTTSACVKLDPTGSGTRS